jgi:hypothetical protein
MFNQHRADNASNISHLVPGYGYYDRLGDSLAEGLLDLIEAIASLFASMRRG